MDWPEKDNVGVIMLTVFFSLLLDLENPGSSDCCTGCFGSSGRKNLLSVAPIVVVREAFGVAINPLDVLN